VTHLARVDPATALLVIRQFPKLCQDKELMLAAVDPTQ